MKGHLVAIFYLLFFVSLNTFSQQDISFDGVYQTDFRTGYFTNCSPGKEYNQIEGSPYLFENWSSGIIKLERGANLKIESCMYDVYKDRIMFLQDETPLYFAYPEDIDRVTFGSSDFINLKLENRNDYFEILIEEMDFVLLKKYKCDIVKGKESDGINKATKDKFKLSYNYYLIKGNAELAKVKIKKKNILELMNDKEQEVKKYIIDNNLKLKNESDLVEIFKFYSTLV
jgi:hypothetical protein